MIRHCLFKSATEKLTVTIFCVNNITKFSLVEQVHLHTFPLYEC